MTKLFVQLLLSVMVGLGAVVGFTSDVRGKVKETWHEAKTFVRETAQSAFQTVADVDFNAEASAEASVKSDVNSDVSANVDAAAQAELDAEVETETEVEAEIENAAIELENEIESALDLDLGPGK